MSVAVSIVTPTKNRLPLLRGSMASVAAQSFTDWEHVIVDDGSDDGTGAEISAMAARDPRIRYIPRTVAQGGANVCRNIAIRESRGEFVIMLDSDDLLRPDCLERRVRIMRENTALDMAVFRAGVFAKQVGDTDRLFHPQDPGDDLLRFLSHDCVWEITSPIWRRDFLLKAGGFDETLLSMQDLELHVRAICAGAKYMLFDDVDHDISWQYDFTRTSVRHVFDKAYIEAAGRVHAALRRAVLAGGLMTWSRDRALVGLGFSTAESWVRAKQLGGALKFWNRSCGVANVPARLWLGGWVMLCIRRAGPMDSGLAFRIVNKWKGWVRFRQEPALLQNGN